jgi:hypothetical protein
MFFAIFKRNAVTEPWKYVLTSTVKEFAKMNAVHMVQIGYCVMTRVFEFKGAGSIPDILPSDTEEKTYPSHH